MQLRRAKNTDFIFKYLRKCFFLNIGNMSKWSSNIEMDFYKIMEWLQLNSLTVKVPLLSEVWTYILPMFIPLVGAFHYRVPCPPSLGDFSNRPLWKHKTSREIQDPFGPFATSEDE